MDKNYTMTKYIGAPYNFVPFSEEVRHYDKKSLPGHNSITCKEKEAPEKECDTELYSGEIDYTITALSKIFVGSGEGKPESFYKDGYGRYAIPGSTVRGLIRNNLQILSLSEMGTDIDDYALMYRKVGGVVKGDGPAQRLQKRYYEILEEKPSTKEKEKKDSAMKRVRAGYITCKKGKYQIYDVKEPAPQKDKKGINYYVLSERDVIDDYLDTKNIVEGMAIDDQRKEKEVVEKCAYSLFFKDGKNILAHENTKRFKREKRQNRIHYVGTPNKAYKPYERECSYECSGNKVIEVRESGRLSHEGFAVSTGKMNEKKAIYIIPAQKMQEDKDFPIDISPKDILAFKADLNKRENALKQFGGRTHWDLPEEGKRRPVFYIQLDGRLYFGFTPHLRVFYDHTIAEGIPDRHKEGRLDYAKAIMGFSNEKDAYRSRVSFTDAICQTEPGVSDRNDKEEVILAEPKPTSFLDYLEEGKNYNDEFVLRGIKQYWLRDEIVAGNKPKDPGDGGSERKYVSQFSPLPKDTSFVGKIRFHNLKKEELGLLLWAIQLESGAQMNIGKAKAYGYGKIDLNINRAARFDLKKAYDLGSLDLDPWGPLDVSALIDNYKTLEKADQKEKSIKTLLKMKDPNAKPDDDETRYMSIDAREYQNRTDPLPGALELIKQYKPVPEVDKEYDAEVVELTGKVKVKISTLPGYYPKILFKDVRIGETKITSKKEAGKIFHKGTRIKVAYRNINGEEFWECVGLSEKI